MTDLRFDDFQEFLITRFKHYNDASGDVDVNYMIWRELQNVYTAYKQFLMATNDNKNT